MRILGISCFYHDAAAALLDDGMLVAASEEERFSRKKHDYNFPKLAIHYCLEQAGITAADLDYVSWNETAGPCPFWKTLFRSTRRFVLGRRGMCGLKPYLGFREAILSIETFDEGKKVRPDSARMANDLIHFLDVTTGQDILVKTLLLMDILSSLKIRLLPTNHLHQHQIVFLRNHDGQLLKTGDSNFLKAVLETRGPILDSGRLDRDLQPRFLPCCLKGGPKTQILHARRRSDDPRAAVTVLRSR